MISLKLIIILYNKKLNESETYISLCENEKDFIICDNSTLIDVAKANEKICEKEDYIYINMNGNKGLSKAYNTALQKISAEEYIMLLDQDTQIPNEYINKIKKLLNENFNYKVILPVVKSNDVIISPALLKGHRVKIKDMNEGIYNNITGINSGMVIKKDIYEKVGYYDENIFLDYVDHNFMRKCSLINEDVYVVSDILYQEFSGHNKSTVGSALTRFKIYKHDFYEFCKDNFSGKIYYYMKIIFRSIKLSCSYKNVKFLFLKNKEVI